MVVYEGLKALSSRASSGHASPGGQKMGQTLTPIGSVMHWHTTDPSKPRGAGAGRYTLLRRS